jgi:hypothetical protein
VIVEPVPLFEAVAPIAATPENDEQARVFALFQLPEDSLLDAAVFSPIRIELELRPVPPAPGISVQPPPRPGGVTNPSR